jgi:mercuric reductase
MTTPNSRWTAEVTGMTCDACQRHVAEAVHLAGGASPEVSWRAGTATFDAVDINEGSLRGAVTAAGYELRSLRRPGPLEVLGKGDGDQFDLAIIGSGSAAFAAAIKATEAGARVVMIEKGTPGGTCVNIGCVPSKALLVAAETHHRATGHSIAGVPHSSGEVDLAAIVAAKDELVDALRQAKYVDLIDDYGIEFRTGTAAFVDADSITVDGEPLTATNYLIATGAGPALPPVEGLAGTDYLTSTTALELTELPARLAVIGANAIGLELGQAFSRLGSEVTFLDIAERIAPFEEPEISAALTGVLVDDGSRVVTGAQIERVTQDSEGTVTLEGDLGHLGSTLQVDRVLVATGRTPNTATLNLDAAGVEHDRGFVVVDEHLRTSNSRVWAAGDVTNSPQFVYVSAAEGAIAADNAIGGAGRTTDYTTLPRVTFTSPQVAAVGLTEAQANDAGHDVIISVLPLAYVPRAIVNGDTRGLIKLVADASTDRLLGVHVLADGAGEVVQAGVYALMAGLTVTEIAGAFHPYLTVAEGLKLAAQTFNRDVAKLSCCAA